MAFIRVMLNTRGDFWSHEGVYSACLHTQDTEKGKPFETTNRGELHKAYPPYLLLPDHQISLIKRNFPNESLVCVSDVRARADSSTSTSSLPLSLHLQHAVRSLALCLWRTSIDWMARRAGKPFRARDTAFRTRPSFNLSLPCVLEQNPSHA